MFLIRIVAGQLSPPAGCFRSGSWRGSSPHKQDASDPDHGGAALPTGRMFLIRIVAGQLPIGRMFLIRIVAAWRGNQLENLQSGRSLLKKKRIISQMFGNLLVFWPAVSLLLHLLKY